MINEEKVYIGICTYNRANSLKRTLESVMKLKYKSYNVVVIDNNSNDNTKEIVSFFPNVTYISEKKQGIAFARNRFLDYC